MFNLYLTINPSLLLIKTYARGLQKGPILATFRRSRSLVLSG